MEPPGCLALGVNDPVRRARNAQKGRGSFALREEGAQGYSLPNNYLRQPVIYPVLLFS